MSQMGKMGKATTEVAEVRREDPKFCHRGHRDELGRPGTGRAPDGSAADVETGDWKSALGELSIPSLQQLHARRAISVSLCELCVLCG